MPALYSCVCCYIIVCMVCITYRLGDPDDCAGAVSFLCSNDAAYITGETIVIAGGTPSRL